CSTWRSRRTVRSRRADSPRAPTGHRLSVRRPPWVLRLGLFGHREDVVARHLPGQLGVRFADVALDLLNELVVRSCTGGCWGSVVRVQSADRAERCSRSTSGRTWQPAMWSLTMLQACIAA